MNILKYIAIAAVMTAALPVFAEEDTLPSDRHNGDDVENAVKAPKRKSVFTRKKSDLIRENSSLRTELDSLRNELGRIREEMQALDSLELELMDVYDENEDKSAAGLNPEDYNAEVSDSLLNIWYLHRKVSDAADIEYDMDTVRFASNVPDSVYIERIKAMNSFIDLPYNSIVRNYIVLYSEKMQDRMGEILGLCSYYMPVISYSCLTGRSERHVAVHVQYGENIRSEDRLIRGRKTGSCKGRTCSCRVSEGLV